MGGLKCALATRQSEATLLYVESGSCCDWPGSPPADRWSGICRCASQLVMGHEYHGQLSSVHGSELELAADNTAASITVQAYG